MSGYEPWMEATIRAGMAMSAEAIAEAFDLALADPDVWEHVLADLTGARPSLGKAHEALPEFTEGVIRDVIALMAEHLRGEATRVLNGEVTITAQGPLDHAPTPDPFEIIARLTKDES